jgi:hypothetical protein
MEADSNQDFKLRPSFQPYAGFTIIFTAVALFMLWPFYKKPDISLVWAALSCWGMLGMIIAMGLSYRIRLQHDAVVQRAFGMRAITIPISQIEKIKVEVSIYARRKSNPWVDRPLRRLVIVPKHDPDMYIDVSLKHFKADDIRQLMRKIREQRSDLSFPKHWI